jgi:pyruvate ferredoxin oxidoreductase gamma subunit
MGAALHATTIERRDNPGGRMFQVRIHGRGGQGVVTAAELLSVAAFFEGKHSQAFPIFGSERTGAPVVAFCRFSDKPIRLREPIVEPDALIVQDPTLLHQVDLFAGVGRDSYILINTSRSTEKLGIDEFLRSFRAERVLVVPATDLAREHVGRPLPNAALLGAFAALTGALSIDSVTAAIRDRFSGRIAEGNVAAAEAAYELAAACADQVPLYA